MKKIYQYSEILKVHRVLEELEKFLIGIKDEKYAKDKQYIKRRIAHLRNELEISDLKDVVKELRVKKRKEAGVLNYVKVYLTDTEIYESSKKNDDKKKRLKKLMNDLERKVMESAMMNE